MGNFDKEIHKILKPLAVRVGSNRVLKTILAAFDMVMPVVILGAVFTLLNNLGFEAYQSFITDTGIKPLLALPARVTADLLAVYITFTAAYSFLKVQGREAEAISAGILSLLCFLIITPLEIGMVNDRTMISFPLEYLGSKGLFTALGTGIAVGTVYQRIAEKTGAAKMSGKIPGTITRSWYALLPGFASIALFLAVNRLFSECMGASLNQWLYDVLGRPLQALSGNILTYCLLMFLSDVFWFFGIHGAQITTPVFIILFMSAGVDNQAALSAGRPMEHILTMGLAAYLTLGGAGTTIGLAVNMLLFSKSERYKALGKLAILPSLCNINEPILFGVPLILNPVMAVPFFAVPQITIILTYIVMRLGLVGLPRLAMGAAGMPVLFDAFLICGISGMVWQFILIGITFAGYYPFFRIQDEAVYREEQSMAVTDR